MLFSYQPELYILSCEKSFTQTHCFYSSRQALPQDKVQHQQFKRQVVIRVREYLWEYFWFRKEGERKFKTLGGSLHVAAPTPWSCTWPGVSEEPHPCCSHWWLQTQLMIVLLLLLPTSVTSSPLLPASVMMALLVLLSKKALNIRPVGKNIPYKTLILVYSSLGSRSAKPTWAHYSFLHRAKGFFW